VRYPRVVGLSSSSLPILVIAIIALAIPLEACAPVGTPATPTPICQSAMACAQVVTFTDNSCPLAFPNPSSPYANSNHFDMLNNHPQKKIMVHYEERVRHLNSLRSDEHLAKWVAVAPGQTAPLGCQRTPGLTSDQYDDWAYTVPWWRNQQKLMSMSELSRRLLLATTSRSPEKSTTALKYTGKAIES